MTVPVVPPIFLATAWFVAPRVMHACDARLTRARFVGAPDRSPRELPTPRVPRKARRDAPVDPSRGLELLARALRSGVPPRSAVENWIAGSWPGSKPTLDPETGLRDAVVACALRTDGEARDLLMLVSAACAGGTVSADGIDSAVSVVRAHARSHDEARAAAAQAGLSVRVLTMLPIGALALVVTTRGSRPLTSPSLILVLVVGLVLNRIGAHWVRDLSRRAATGAPDPAAPLLSSLAVSLRAGLDPVSACSGWRDINATGRAAATLIDEHRPLREALVPLASSSPLGEETASLIVESVSSGLPLVPMAARILDRVRDEERRAVDVRVRQLPVRLSAPVVLCVLPSFVLLAVVPMVITAFPHGLVALIN